MKSISKQSVTEVKTLANPPQEVKNVVTATVILLGMSQEEAKRYEAIRARLSRGGPESIDRRSASLAISTVPVEAALAAQDLIKNVSGDSIKKKSMATFHFYEWNKQVIESVLERQAQGQEEISNAQSQ